LEAANALEKSDRVETAVNAMEGFQVGALEAYLHLLEPGLGHLSCDLRVDVFDIELGGKPKALVPIDRHEGIE
jgi:hypothetical protein